MAATVAALLPARASAPPSLLPARRRRPPSFSRAGEEAAHACVGVRAPPRRAHARRESRLIGGAASRRRRRRSKDVVDEMAPVVWFVGKEYGMPSQLFVMYDNMKGVIAQLRFQLPRAGGAGGSTGAQPHELHGGSGTTGTTSVVASLATIATGTEPSR